jgi:hypothetical protein
MSTLTSVVEYDPSTGDILTTRQLPVPDADALAATPGHRIGEGTCDGHYVDLATGEIREKAPCPAVLDGTTLRQLPTPCTLTIGLMVSGFRLMDDTSTHVVTDGEAELSCDQGTTHWVAVESAPYRTARFEVTP